MLTNLTRNEFIIADHCFWPKMFKSINRHRNINAEYQCLHSTKTFLIWSILCSVSKGVANFLFYLECGEINCHDFIIYEEFLFYAMPKFD